MLLRGSWLGRRQAEGRATFRLPTVGWSNTGGASIWNICARGGPSPSGYRDPGSAMALGSTLVASLTTFRSCDGGAVWGVLPGRCFSRPDRTPTHPPACTVACHNFPHICDFVSSRCASQVIAFHLSFTGFLLARAALPGHPGRKCEHGSKPLENPHCQSVVERCSQLEVAHAFRFLHAP
jgi:hypothetical protein